MLQIIRHPASRRIGRVCVPLLTTLQICSSINCWHLTEILKQSYEFHIFLVIAFLGLVMLFQTNRPADAVVVDLAVVLVGLVKFFPTNNCIPSIGVDIAENGPS